MNQQSTNKPRTLISQNDRSQEAANYAFPAADFVLVDDSPLHLWVNGIHFVEDPDGAVQEGQHFLVQDPGQGVTISKVEHYDNQNESATVRHLYQWYDGDLESVDDSEVWSTDEIIGEYDRAMGDASKSTFLHQVA
ncbi:hypothetical protein CV102_17595 [Natronococcus pandeyae]|uniref:Uncharacterized protein n=2 Tax=Natronococcus pandeyae TaxID=2055836 RepID=A0A8J8Q2P6_9EURY|nr:hypothetical protein CV102_17595 [Natronococcus pandeyae]